MTPHSQVEGNFAFAIHAASDDIGDESQTQQTTQSTQVASQQPSAAFDAHLWGYLQPCSQKLTRIDFWRQNRSCCIGRNRDQNDVILPGTKVSNRHCIIEWDGRDDDKSSITIRDLSSNGTFINGEKIGKNNTHILREGNEVAFGTALPQPADMALEDYRFIYRHLAAGPAKGGLYAFYDIATELGKGSFATVVKAINRADGRWYAVKMIQNSKVKRITPTGTGGANNPNEIFVREISILEDLKHPNICQLKEVFWDATTINLVLELVDGGDLLEYILLHNGLEEDRAKHITYQMCDALAYIHSKGIAHRDLKPENVLLTSDDPPIVKVADFGLAKVVDSLTMLRTMCGTPNYLAPEVVTQVDQEGYDKLVDSWSVGVIVFAMLANASPFIEDENERDIAKRIRLRVVDWTSLSNVGTSHEGQCFVRALLDVDPVRRMTLSDARHHAWLRSRSGYHLHRSRSLAHSPSAESIPDDGQAYELERDSSMVPEEPAEEGKAIRIQGATEDISVSNGIQHLQLNSGKVVVPQDSAADMVSSIPGAYVNGNGVKADKSRTAALRRRSDVVKKAAEEPDVHLLEPSGEMIQQAERQHPAAESSRGGRGNKRLRSEGTPLPDEMENGGSGSRQSRPVAGPSAPRKKTKDEEEDKPVPSGNPSPRKAGSARGKGRAAAAAAAVSRGKVNRASGRPVAVEEEQVDVLKLRRTPRFGPQKAARR